jgi:hypothetical protein
VNHNVVPDSATITNAGVFFDDDIVAEANV